MNDVLTAAHPDNRVEQLAISDKDKENFLKSVLADAPYEETIPLFDGQSSLSFRALTIEQHEDHLDQVNRDEKAGIPSKTDAYFTRFLSYRMAMSLFKVDGKPFHPDITKDKYTGDEAKTYVGARADVFNSWSAFKLSIYIEAFNRFEKKIVQLAQEVQTPNFWKATARTS